MFAIKESKKEGYRPPTDLLVGRLSPSATNTTTEGTTEAAHLFDTFPAFHPVGPYHDRRNGRDSSITRFRLEASDRTAISYVVGHNITREGVDAIKTAYAQRKMEKRNANKKITRTKRKTHNKLKGKRRKNGKRDDGKSVSSKMTMTTTSVDQTLRSRPAITTAEPPTQQPRNSTATTMSINEPNTSLSLEILETARGRLQMKALEPQHTGVQSQEEVTLVDLIVDKLTSDFGLTQDQKRLFLQYVKPLARELRKKGVQNDKESMYLEHCKDVLTTVYRDGSKKENEMQSLGSELKALEDKENSRFKELDNADKNMGNQLAKIRAFTLRSAVDALMFCSVFSARIWLQIVVAIAGFILASAFNLVLNAFRDISCVMASITSSSEFSGILEKANVVRGRQTAAAPSL